MGPLGMEFLIGFRQVAGLEEELKEKAVVVAEKAWAWVSPIPL